MISASENRLRLSEIERRALWNQITEFLETYPNQLKALPVAPRVEQAEICHHLAQFGFQEPKSPKEAVEFVIQGLTSGNLHTAHPSYYGVFNPAPSTMGIAGEIIAAAVNPQLASWISSPFAIEVEQHVLKAFAALFGYAASETEGTFTVGGTEANHTALLTALTNRYPDFAKTGVRGLGKLPVIYVSSESHHSFVKAARLTGLGTDAICEIPALSNLAFDTQKLSAQIQKDRMNGKDPFFVVGTFGTTNAGTVDSFSNLAQLSKNENLWLHADAAWGGAAILLPEMKSFFKGIELADSITLDAHKWLAVPMTAGIYLNRHRGILEKTFRVDKTYYMPPESLEGKKCQPYAESMSWSRRFIGLKVFLSLAVAGWEGYREVLRHQVKLGNLLRSKLQEKDWEVLNETPLPVLCFRDKRNSNSHSAEAIEAFAKKIGDSGKAWITTTRLGASGTPALRAGITNFVTAESDIVQLVDLLDQLR